MIQFEAARFNCCSTAVHESGFGTKRTCRAGLMMSSYRGRPEVAIAPPDFRV
jgi:hypothetical protein